MEAPFTWHEVKAAVWGCGGDKSPGPDAFAFAFIKKFWDTIGVEVFGAIKSF